MDIILWKQKDFSGREFILSDSEEPFSKLDFKSWSSYDAVYTSGSTSISFTSHGWLEQEISICYAGKNIGTASTSVLGKTQLRLLTGEVYDIKSQTLSFNRTVLDATGNIVISYRQPTCSFGKGTIEVSDALADLTKEVLVSTSLYLKAVSEQQVAVLIAIFMPLYINMIT